MAFKQIGSFDLDTIKSQTQSKYISMSGWSLDGTRIMVLTSNYPKATCYELDPLTNQLKEIMSVTTKTGQSLGLTCNLYDVNKKLFVHGLVENSHKLYLAKII